MTSTVTTLDADAENRGGRLGPKQAATLARVALARRLTLAVSGTVLGVLGVTLTAMLVAGLLVGEPEWQRAAFSLWLTAATGVAGAYCAWLALRPGGDAMTRDVRDGIVTELMGPVETGLIEDDEHGAVAWIRIANARFEVDDELRQAMAAGTTWRAYVLPRSGHLVALEPVDPAYPALAAA